MTSALTRLGTGAAALALLGLGACNAENNGGDDGARLHLTGAKYCTAFKSATTNTAQPALATAPADPGAALEDCVHRWGYALAPARDPADIVAQAVLDACSPLVQQAANQSQNSQGQGLQSQGPGDEQSAADQGGNPQAQQMRLAESRALFYVVQARAGGCAPPPASSVIANPAG